ncbi:MAG: 5' nucleotidase, NT5C type [Microthrixaceae bacterium]
MSTGSEFVLGVDLDGVCADYTGGFRSVASIEWNVPESSLTTEVSWDFGEWGLDREGFLALHRASVQDHRMFRDMPAIEGASESLWRLSDAGVWIRVITHRLVTNWGHAIIVSDTVEWLDLRRIPYRDLCFLGRKPEVQADAYIEDAPHNVEALRAGGNTVIVFDQPYNRELPGLRAHNWTEVELIVADLVAERGGSFATQLPGLDAGADRLDRRKQL